MLQIKTLKTARALKGKKVLVRTDFNVPLKNGRVSDDFRLRAALPTLKYLRQQGARVIIVSHLGRPDGKVAPEFGLKVLVPALTKLLKTSVIFCPENIGPKAQKAVDDLKSGQILLLENIRFQPGEEKNERALAKALAGLADVYVNEAFSVSHRAHASVCAITEFLPSYAGLALADEVKNLDEALHPVSPAVAILGGAKISTKIGLIKNLARHFDSVLIGGALANNFIQAAGFEVGQSVVDADYQVKIADYNFQKICLPVDALVLTVKGEVATRLVDEVKPKEKILDIGPRTIKIFNQKIAMAKSIVWNGPMGWFEDPRFKKGTRALALAVKKNLRARAVVGGGETVAAVSGLINARAQKTRPKLFISTAGGAMLEYLEGKILPGIKPLIEK